MSRIPSIGLPLISLIGVLASSFGCPSLVAAQASATSPGIISPVPGQVPVNQPARGLVYDGLEPGTDGACVGLFRIKGTIHCTHGPDPAPAGINVRTAAAPTAEVAVALTSAAQCDGDGTSGNRAQVLYVRGADRPDQLGAYQASFQQWASDADTIYLNSAAQTGGFRRLRFVHDASCNMVIANVQIGDTGAVTFDAMLTSLQALGYARGDRKYMIFMDTSLYCGIGTVQEDDSLSSGNLNNFGPSYARV